MLSTLSKRMLDAVLTRRLIVGKDDERRRSGKLEGTGMTNLRNGQDIDIVLRDTDGEEWRSRDYLGKMIIIHTCRGEF